MNTFFKTQDLYVATVLTALGFSLDGIELDAKDSKALFYYAQSEELLKVVENYWKKALVIEPQTTFQAYRLVRSRLHEVQKRS